MATTYDAESSRMGTRPTGAGIVVVADRSESFRQARSHSKLVRVLRLALPAVGVVLILGYVGALVGNNGFAPSLPEMAMPRITPQDLSMQNPNYEGVTADGGSYRVAAARALHWQRPLWSGARIPGAEPGLRRRPTLSPSWRGMAYSSALGAKGAAGDSQPAACPSPLR